MDAIVQFFYVETRCSIKCDLTIILPSFVYSSIIEIEINGECKLMMVSHDALVEMQTWKNNNLLTWMDYSMYFYIEFGYGVRI